MSVSAVVKAQEGVEDFRDLRLHIVLVEKELEYMGMNGLPFHQMVVRYMFGGSEGYPMEFTDDRFSAGSEKNLTEISSWILEYLYDLEDRLVGYVWPGFSITMHDIDPGNLMIIAFVQEGRRNHVLQAKVIDLN